MVIIYSDPNIKKMYCKRCNSKLNTAKPQKGKEGIKRKRAVVECSYCLFKNKLYSSYFKAVVIKD